MNYKEMKSELTKILSDKKFRKSHINKLNDMGFTVDDTGKHNKMYYKGDKDHPIIVSKTLSDSSCGGKNLVSVIMRIVKEVDDNQLKDIELLK